MSHSENVTTRQDLSSVPSNWPATTQNKHTARTWDELNVQAEPFSHRRTLDYEEPPMAVHENH